MLPLQVIVSVAQERVVNPFVPFPLTSLKKVFSTCLPEDSLFVKLYRMPGPRLALIHRDV